MRVVLDYFMNGHLATSMHKVIKNDWILHYFMNGHLPFHRHARRPRCPPLQSKPPLCRIRGDVELHIVRFCRVRTVLDSAAMYGSLQLQTLRGGEEESVGGEEEVDDNKGTSAPTLEAPRSCSALAGLMPPANGLHSPPSVLVPQPYPWLRAPSMLRI